jgi:hypothetical protein
VSLSRPIKKNKWHTGKILFPVVWLLGDHRANNERIKHWAVAWRLLSRLGCNVTFSYIPRSRSFGLMVATITICVLSTHCWTPIGDPSNKTITGARCKWCMKRDWANKFSCCSLEYTYTGYRNRCWVRTGGAWATSWPPHGQSPCLDAELAALNWQLLLQCSGRNTVAAFVF